MREESLQGSLPQASRGSTRPTSRTAVSPPSPKAASLRPAVRRGGGTARPRPASPCPPCTGSAAASHGPDTPKPQLSGEQRCGAEPNPCATGGWRGGRRGKGRGRREAWARELSTSVPQTLAENETSTTTRLLPPICICHPNLKAAGNIFKILEKRNPLTRLL